MKIVADEDCGLYFRGTGARVELEDEGKCNVLLKMYKKKGRVYCEKSVKNMVIQKEKDTKLKRYPVAMMNWETRKNSCHGMAEVTGLIRKSSVRKQDSCTITAQSGTDKFPEGSL